MDCSLTLDKFMHTMQLYFADGPDVFGFVIIGGAAMRFVVDAKRNTEVRAIISQISGEYVQR